MPKLTEAAKKKAAAKKAAAKKTPAKRKRGSVANEPTPDRPKHEVTGNYKVTGDLSVPLVKFNPGDSYAFTINNVMRMVMPGGKTKIPATILRATDLDTGEISDFISTQVLNSTLEREYGATVIKDELAVGVVPDGSPWIGKSILISCSKRPGKRYFDVRVQEINPK